MPDAGAYWLDLGELESVRMIDYTGDGVDNRLIDLGGVYDVAVIFSRDAFGMAANWVMAAWALRDAYSLLVILNGIMSGLGGANCDGRWKGFSSATRDKLDLGNTGAGAGGTNVNARLFRVMALKFRSLP